MHQSWPYLREAKISSHTVMLQRIGRCVDAKRKGDFLCITPVAEWLRWQNSLSLGKAIVVCWMMLWQEGTRTTKGVGYHVMGLLGCDQARCPNKYKYSLFIRVSDKIVPDMRNYWLHRLKHFMVVSSRSPCDRARFWTSSTHGLELVARNNDEEYPRLNKGFQPPLDRQKSYAELNA
ncbi:hypothetical protein Tco_0435416 [Tanacetum coccineum]